MKIVEIRQPFWEKYQDPRTDVYVLYHYQSQRELCEWCTEMFGDYRLTYSKFEIDEPQGCTVFIFENLEQAMAFRLQFGE